MPGPLRLAAVLLLSCLAGCGDLVRAKVYDHVVATGLHDPPRRLVVVNALDITYGGDLPDRFGTAISAELARCGIASLVQRADPLQLQDTPAFQARVNAFRPDGMLTVLLNTSTRNVADVRADLYTVRLWDVPQRRDLWRGLLKLDSASPLVVDRSGTGALLASRIVRQLSGDGVLAGCPPFPS